MAALTHEFVNEILIGMLAISSWSPERPTHISSSMEEENENKNQISEAGHIHDDGTQGSDRIGKVDIPPKFAKEDNGDLGILKGNLNTYIDVINAMCSEMTKMQIDQASGDVDVPASEEKFTGAYRQIVSAANEAVRSHVANILKILNLTGAYADGDFSQTLPDFPGKRIIAIQRINLLHKNLLSVINEMARMDEAQRAGDIDAYVPEEKFAGAWRQLAEGANQGVRLHVNNVLSLLKIVASYADGDFNPVLERLPGKQAVANENMDLLRNNLLRVSKEVRDLTEAIVNGKLATRGDADAFAGDWHRLMTGVNALMYAFKKPIGMTSDYTARIGEGNNPPKITEDLKGDFNTI